MPAAGNFRTKKRAACGNARFFGCFRLRWMASSSAEASSYAQGFGVTRRLGKQAGGKEIRGPAFAIRLRQLRRDERLRRGKQWSEVRCQRLLRWVIRLRRGFGVTGRLIVLSHWENQLRVRRQPRNNRGRPMAAGRKRDVRNFIGPVPRLVAE
jgi:hypothetical protein